MKGEEGKNKRKVTISTLQNMVALSMKELELMIIDK
jgi:hypothetical protein